MTELFTRDGHLSDLTLERIVQGEIEQASVADYLENCALCRERLEHLRADTASFVYGTPPIAPSSSRRLPFGYGTLVALAAVLLLFFNLPDQTTPQPGTPEWTEPPDNYRVKGGLSVGFFVKRDGSVIKAQDNGIVHPGDQLGFQVSSPVAGHLMIIGVDQSQKPISATLRTRVAIHAFGPTKEMTTLEQAVALDEVLGQEHFTAIFCERQFGFDEVAKQLSATPQQGGHRMTLNSGQCRQRVIRLQKTKRATP